MVIDLGSGSCGTPEDSFTDNVVYLLGGKNEGSFQACRLLIGCGKYGSIWPAVSLYVRHARVCANMRPMRRHADRCDLFPRQALYTDQQGVRTCVRPCVCVVTLETERRREGEGEPGWCTQARAHLVRHYTNKEWQPGRKGERGGGPRKWVMKRAIRETRQSRELIERWGGGVRIRVGVYYKLYLHEHCVESGL